MDTTYQVTSFTDDQLAMFVKQRTLTPEVEQALRVDHRLERRVAAVYSEIGGAERETEQIFKDQERLRENLKALKGSSEERSLVSRYTASSTTGNAPRRAQARDRRARSEAHQLQPNSTRSSRDCRTGGKWALLASCF